jgi:four helix bundle protein
MYRNQKTLLTPIQKQFFAKPFREIKQYSSAIAFANQIYQFKSSFTPMPNNVINLFDQVQRSADSVPANLSEGWGRSSNGYMNQFLGISIGSLAESITHLELLSNRLPDHANRIQEFVADGERLLDDLNVLRALFLEREAA